MLLDTDLESDGWETAPAFSSTDCSSSDKRSSHAGTTDHCSSVGHSIRSRNSSGWTSTSPSFSSSSHTDRSKSDRLSDSDDDNQREEKEDTYSIDAQVQALNISETRVKTSLRSSKRKAREPPEPAPVGNQKLLELSVTVGYLGQDVVSDEMSKLDRMLREKCVNGLFSLERGEQECHLHFQGVVRTYGTTARAFGSVVRQYMGWDKSSSKDKGRGRITCKVLAQRNLHTFKGMVGYCVKDEGLEHFKVVSKNITEDIIKEGRTLHQLYGTELKGKVVITNRNIFDRARMFHMYAEKKLISRTFAGILLGMLKSGKYYPAATWITPFQGRGMDIRKASSMWTTILHPQDTTLEDVYNVFFDNKSPVRGRYHKEEWEHVEEVEMELQRRADEAAEREDLPLSPEELQVNTDLGDLTWSDHYVPLVQPRGMFHKDYLHFTARQGDKEKSISEDELEVEVVEGNGVIYERNKGKFPMLVAKSIPRGPTPLDLHTPPPDEGMMFLEDLSGDPTHGGASCSYDTGPLVRGVPSSLFKAFCKAQ